MRRKIMNKILLFELKQPIGKFYLGQMNSKDLLDIADTPTRRNNIGIQRGLKSSRLKDIANYTSDPEAIFPTPIILSVKMKNPDYLLETTDNHKLYDFDLDMIEYA